jgi:GTP-binding protein
MLDKERFVAITKSDMLDKELMGELKEHLDNEGAFDGAPYMFISSINQLNLVPLKDQLWKMLNE